MYLPAEFLDAIGSGGARMIRRMLVALTAVQGEMFGTFYFALAVLLAANRSGAASPGFRAARFRRFTFAAPPGRYDSDHADTLGNSRATICPRRRPAILCRYGLTSFRATRPS